MYGIKLRQLRRQLGLTQRQLGTLCGVGGTTISMIEHGKRLPGRETLRRLQAVLGDLPPRQAPAHGGAADPAAGVSPCKGQDGPQASPSPAGDGLSGRSPLRRLRRRACGPPIPATPPAFKNAKTPERPTGPSGAVFTCRLSPPRFFPSPPSGQPLWPPRPSRQCAYRRIPSPGHKSPQRPGSPAPCR